MVGRLSLQDVPELVDTKKKGDGVLDSPDSGLPPSPSPSHWGLAAAAGGGGERAAVPGALEPDASATPAAPMLAGTHGVFSIPQWLLVLLSSILPTHPISLSQEAGDTRTAWYLEEGYRGNVREQPPPPGVCITSGAAWEVPYCWGDLGSQRAGRIVRLFLGLCSPLIALPQSC
ncbi:refilin-B isoform X2 [Nannospalax galili]|uniref:refilin-B isoform X2 n=1 Tax=Nannospalax galili TaxID=1026970 RepID=UPI00111BEB44|nr:refilin-B isoform X2 [Nannospalax galili]